MNTKPYLQTMLGWILLTCLPLLAQEDTTPKPGLQVSLTGGVLLGQFTDQMTVYQGKNKRIESLDDNGSQFTFVAPVAEADIQYTFAKYLTTLACTVGIDHVSGATDFRVIQPLGEIANLSGGITGHLDEVWQDPYWVSVDRKSTRRRTDGLSMGLENLLNSGCCIEYVYGRVDIETDAVGQKYPTLKRDGNHHNLDLAWILPLDGIHILTPIFSLRQEDLKGSANSYHGYYGGLTYDCITERLHLEASVGYGKHTYDAIHPVFNQTRAEKLFLAELNFTIPNLCYVEKLSGNIGVSYFQQDANIGFFDANLSLLRLGVAYNF